MMAIDDKPSERHGQQIETGPSQNRQNETGAESVPGTADDIRRTSITDRSRFARELLTAKVSPRPAAKPAAKIEAPKKAPPKTVQELSDRLFKNAPRIDPPEGAYNAQKVRQWRERYSGQDKTYDRLRGKKRKAIPKTLHQDITEGWDRMTKVDEETKTSQLQELYKICWEQNVPFEVIFLGLAESHWKNTARSPAGAGGYWQFMPRTARAYGLRVDKKGAKNRVDERTDFRKSTIAAIKYLKGLYRNTFAWDNEMLPKESQKPIPKNIFYNDNDRWAYAFWSYNRGPGKVKPYYKQLKGKAENYASTIRGINPENAAYVNKIFGIRAALQEYALGKKGAPPIVVAQAPVSAETPTPPEKPTTAPAPAPKPASAEPEPAITTSPADRMYEQYMEEEEKLTAKQKLQMLTRVRAAYATEGRAGTHIEDYTDDATDVIDEEIANVKRENAKDLAQDISVNGTVFHVTADRRSGEMSVKMEKRNSKGKVIEKFRAAIVEYTVQPGDNLTKIAIRLTGDPNKVGLTKKILAAVNPEIEDLNLIKLGQTIRVPGQFITVKPGPLSQVLKYYSPALRKNGDAEKYLKWLNGLKPTDYIRAGQTILVPAVR